nr:putative phage abortive infection protein [uncultured Bacteroides sp.]
MGKWIRENVSLLLLIGVCVVVYTIILLLSNLLSDKPNEFGGSAGVASGLFSAVAFAGVVYAIFLQKKELELQRDELKQTREELEGQKHEFEQQNETLKRQRFESTFFNMLSLQQTIIQNLQYTQPTMTQGLIAAVKDPSTISEKLYNGREVFGFFYAEVNTIFTVNGKQKSYQGGLKQAISNFNYTIYSQTNLAPYFDYYFRHLYRIIKFVDESPLLLNSFEDRYQYTSMVRAQLSRYELIWLFYNCLSSNGIDKFKPLIEKYALLKNMRFELLVEEDHRNLYAQSAYEKTLPKDTCITS